MLCLQLVIAGIVPCLCAVGADALMRPVVSGCVDVSIWGDSVVMGWLEVRFW